MCLYMCVCILTLLLVKCFKKIMVFSRFFPPISDGHRATENFLNFLAETPSCASLYPGIKPET